MNLERSDNLIRKRIKVENRRTIEDDLNKVSHWLSALAGVWGTEEETNLKKHDKRSIGISLQFILREIA